MASEVETGTAVIVGGGVCGLLTAASVSTSFRRVVVLERDDVEIEGRQQLATDVSAHSRLFEEAANRKSVFQGLHTHTLTSGGLKVFEELLPGFTQCCKSYGAQFPGMTHPINDNTVRGYFRPSPAPSGTFKDPRCVYVLATRILIERCVRETLLHACPNVEWRSPVKMSSLIWDADKAAVTGVKLNTGEEIHAAMTVDASGARSKAAIDFLKERGVEDVPTRRVDPGLSYYTRYFRMPQQRVAMPVAERTQLAFHSILPPHTHHQTIMEVEGNMLQANLGILNGGKCGKELEDFLTFFKPPYAPSSVFYEMLEGAEPVGPMISWLGAHGTVRRCFERVRMPEGYIVLGDAIASLNPRFATGMTVAAMQARMLGKLLEGRRPCSGQHGMLSSADVGGCSNQAQRKAADILQFPFEMATEGDLVYDFCKGREPRSVMNFIKNCYMATVIDLLGTNLDVARSLILTVTFLRPPSEMQRPGIAFKVVKRMIADAWAGLGSGPRMLLASAGMLAAAVPIHYAVHVGKLL